MILGWKTFCFSTWFSLTYDSADYCCSRYLFICQTIGMQTSSEKVLNPSKAPQCTFSEGVWTLREGWRISKASLVSNWWWGMWFVLCIREVSPVTDGTSWCKSTTSIFSKQFLTSNDQGFGLNYLTWPLHHGAPPSTMLVFWSAMMLSLLRFSLSLLIIWIHLVYQRFSHAQVVQPRLTGTVRRGFWNGPVQAATAKGSEELHPPPKHLGLTLRIPQLSTFFFFPVWLILVAVEHLDLFTSWDFSLLAAIAPAHPAHPAHSHPSRNHFQELQKRLGLCHFASFPGRSLRRPALQSSPAARRGVYKAGGLMLLEK